MSSVRNNKYPTATWKQRESAPFQHLNPLSLNPMIPFSQASNILAPRCFKWVAQAIPPVFSPCEAEAFTDEGARGYSKFQIVYYTPQARRE